VVLRPAHLFSAPERWTDDDLIAAFKTYNMARRRPALHEPAPAAERKPSGWIARLFRP
jgi:hypothetical protein